MCFQTNLIRAKRKAVFFIGVRLCFFVRSLLRKGYDLVSLPARRGARIRGRVDLGQGRSGPKSKRTVKTRSAELAPLGRESYAVDLSFVSEAGQVAVGVQG